MQQQKKVSPSSNSLNLGGFDHCFTSFCWIQLSTLSSLPNPRSSSPYSQLISRLILNHLFLLVSFDFCHFLLLWFWGFLFFLSIFGIRVLFEFLHLVVLSIFVGFLAFRALNACIFAIEECCSCFSFFLISANFLCWILWVSCNYYVSWISSHVASLWKCIRLDNTYLWSFLQFLYYIILYFLLNGSVT